MRRLCTISARAVALVVSAALVLASCTDYKARLSDGSDAESVPGIVPPQPAKEKRSVWQGEKTTGWVHLRFDVSETGEVSGVEVVKSSEERLEVKAMEGVASWPFEPGTREGEPAAFEDVEMVMVFYTDDTTTTGEAIGKTVLVIVMIPLMVAAALLGGGGSIKFGN